MQNKHGSTVMPPSTEFGNAQAYAGYKRKGDPFFVVGLSFDEYIDQRDRMLNNHQQTAQNQPYFYSKRNERYGE